MTAALSTIVLTLPAAAAATDSGAAITPHAAKTGQPAGPAAPEHRCPPGTKPVRKGCIPRGAAHVRAGERCRSARLAVPHYRGLTWERQRARHVAQGPPPLADRTPVVRGKTCRWARHAASEWQARAKAAKASLERWTRERTLRDFRVRPGASAWLRAVEEAQKAYPGTRDWLVSCSHPESEGGWGRWVPNTQGSGAGGWLQFMSGTFWRMFSAAKAELERRGYRIPASAASWYSPLGQALAGAWGYVNGRRHEWSGSGC